MKKKNQQKSFLSLFFSKIYCVLIIILYFKKTPFIIFFIFWNKNFGTNFFLPTFLIMYFLFVFLFSKKKLAKVRIKVKVRHKSRFTAFLFPYAKYNTKCIILGTFPTLFHLFLCKFQGMPVTQMM